MIHRRQHRAQLRGSKEDLEERGVIGAEPTDTISVRTPRSLSPRETTHPVRNFGEKKFLSLSMANRCPLLIYGPTPRSRIARTVSCYGRAFKMPDDRQTTRDPPEAELVDHRLQHRNVSVERQGASLRTRVAPRVGS